jgi:hypothetical protein
MTNHPGRMSRCRISACPPVGQQITAATDPWNTARALALAEPRPRCWVAGTARNVNLDHLALLVSRASLPCPYVIVNGMEPYLWAAGARIPPLCRQYLAGI